MTSEKTIRVLKLEWPTGFGALHCPAFGKEVAFSGEACQHLDFIYSPESGSGFDYVSEFFSATAEGILNEIAGLEERIENDEDIHDDLLAIDSHLLRLPDWGSNFIFQIVTEGAACGPMTMVSYYGFDTAESDRAGDD